MHERSRLVTNSGRWHFQAERTVDHSLDFLSTQGTVDARTSAKILKLAKEQQEEELGISRGQKDDDFPSLAASSAGTSRARGAQTVQQEAEEDEDEDDEEEYDEDHDFGDEEYEELVSRQSTSFCLLSSLD